MSPRIMATMVNLGNLTIDAPFYQAGLAGYSDAAMRLIARRHGCPYTVTEALLDVFLINGGKGLKDAALDAQDHPICGQLMGSHPKEIAEAAQVLVKLGYDVVDVNLACPVKKVKKRARGGHLLSVPQEATEILDAVKQAVGDDVPLTVKLRRGSDDSPEALDRFYRIFETIMDLGYAGTTVHGRTVEQKYVGPSNWDFLRNLVKRYGLDDPNHPFTLGGSGDIWTARDIFRMLDQTGVRLVSVARGCIGNPWIFKQAQAYITSMPDKQPGQKWLASHEATCDDGDGCGGGGGGGDESVFDQPPTIFEQREVLYEHFQLSVTVHGEKKASMMMRKFGIKFAQHHPEQDTVKKAFIAVRSLDEWEQVLQAHYASDGPGRYQGQLIPEDAEEASCTL